MEFQVKIHCEIKVKLVFHEILRKKNFTVYRSLKIKSFQCALGIMIGIMFISANLAYFFILKEKSTWFINNVINQLLISLLFDTQVYFNVKKEQ